MSGLDPTYVSLLGLSEAFLQVGDVKRSLQCLQSVLALSPPLTPTLEARTHLQLGVLLKQRTKNRDLAKHHVEQAWYQSQKISPFDGDVLFESGVVLAQFFEEEGQFNHVKQVLRKGIELSQNHSYWHCRLLFQLAGIHAVEKDYVSAVTVLGAGVDFAFMAGANYTRLLFMLSKTMLLLLERKYAEANPILHTTGPMIENWVQQNTHQKEMVAKQQKEYLQMFFLVLQVCYYLMVGQVKSVKTVLKQLQQSIQTITAQGWPPDEEMVSTNPADNFQWLSKDHLCILVYLVTVMHSMQAGYMDKAQKYTDKAIAQIDKLKTVENKPILSSFHVLLLEHIIQCRLVTGNKGGAVQELGHLCRLLEGNHMLLQRHRAQLHTLLGLYAMSMNQMDWAETQLNAALRTSQERELWTFANLNLAIVYLRSRRDADFVALLDRISPERLPSQSHSLQAAAFYIQGLQAFFAAKYNDSKRYLRETLKMANAEDLNRLTSCSLVLLGHIFLSLGNSRESMNMVTPAMQLASKIPDVNVQLWASAILKDLYRMSGDHMREQEGLQMHTSYSQVLLEDHFRATQLPEHNLIQWTDGPFPQFPPSAPIANTTPLQGGVANPVVGDGNTQF
ncbi:hypothetical protein TCAL_05258 [Tigriopus californicus]|uniref:MAU2 chromatid cohesion factor homolog n=1 Tax=Tigriopus californicus TaxID=6832 RepID=A0A553NQG8_TIGCA|nr:MAU2 chromatid cohesion factor homolog [Tigriopus californicus]TRY67660.1 hypothetical protein TCAL_05258 [Tigriopus californicus]